MIVNGWAIFPLLAQKPHIDAFWIAVWGAVLIAALIAAWVLFSWLRRRYFIAPPPETGNVWTLDGLRQLRREGMLSDEEYNRLRDQLVEAIRGEPPAKEPAVGTSAEGAGLDEDAPAESGEPPNASEHKNSESDSSPPVDDDKNVK